MEGEVQELVDRTGLCVPLAARIMRMIGESGASQLEISTALDLVSHLRHHIKTSIVPEDLQNSWTQCSR